MEWRYSKWCIEIFRMGEQIETCMEKSQLIVQKKKKIALRN